MPALPKPKYRDNDYIDIAEVEDAEISDIPWATPMKGYETSRFWYKARGLSGEGNPASWEGGFSAVSLGSALSVVKIRSLHWKAREIYFLAVFEVDPETGAIELDPSLWQNVSEKTWKPADMRLELTGPNHPVDKFVRGDNNKATARTTEYCDRVRAANDKIQTKLNKESEIAAAVHTAYDTATWLQDPDIELPTTFSTLTIRTKVKETDNDSHSRS